MIDHKDLVIAPAFPRCDTMMTAAEIRWTPFADEPAESLFVSPDLDDQVVDVILEAQSYREMMQVALQQLRDLTKKHEQLQASHARLLDEYHHLRGRTMRETVTT